MDLFRTIVTWSTIVVALAAPSARTHGFAPPPPSCGFHTTADAGGGGGQVAIGQDIMLVRVWEEPHTTTTPRIEIRRHVNGSWPVIQTLMPQPGFARDSWGTALATDGQTIVIGDFAAVWGGFGASGVVTVYRRQNNTFVFDAYITGPTTCTGLMFGGGVAVDKDTLVVSRPNNDTTCGLTVPPREAYIFKRVNSTWTYVQSVVPPAGQEPGFFGRSIVAVCDHLFIGSRGRVFQYHLNGTSWQYVGFLDPPGSGSNFGEAMSGAGRFVAIGDYNNSLEGTPIRAVYMYEDTAAAGTHVLRHTVTSPESPIYIGFGYSVSLAGETLLVGAWDVKAFVFRKNPSSHAWNFLMELPDPAGSTTGTFVAAGPNVMATSGARCHIFTCTAGIGGFTGCGDGDLDGDALLDEWETMGIPTGDAQVPRLILDADGDGQGDADYQHKDIFVEVEAVLGFHPPAQAIVKVVEAFDAVSNDLVQNPNGQPGIDLHLQLDDWNLPDLVWTEDDLDGNGTLDWPLEFDDLKLTYAAGGTINGYFGTESERAQPAATAAAIREAKKKAYRYCIFAKSPNPGETTSGQAEIGGNDFFITLGLWNSGAGGTPDQHAGTFMHELGHTLGLRHGGGDSVRYKPNYYSVMNYIWQTPKPWFLPYQWPLAEGRPGYSPALIPPLNELELPNCQPVIDLKSPFAGISFPFNSQPHGQPPVIIRRNFEGDVDWTGGECDISGNVAIDLNRLLPSQAAGADTHVGFSDWPALSYNFRADAEYVDGVHLGASGEEELTEELDLELQALLPAHCHGDLTNDRTVNVGDLLALISSWGACLPPCDADLAPPGWPDHQVNVADLLELISRWGACP